MGESFITRRGGGIPYAIIGVTYPAGSVCTCTNGTRTITAKDTSGKALFVIPAAGTWTVKAVKGSQSASKAVSITAEGQAVTVTLAYDYMIFSNATGLNSVYSDGGGGAPVEIGTDSSGKKILTFNADGYSRMSYLKPAIDLTNYNVLKISGYADGNNAYLAFWSKVPLEYAPSVVAKVTLSNGSSPSSYTIDISKLSGNYYLGAQYAAADIVTYDLRLE